VDGVALYVRAGRTKRDVAVRAKRILDDVGANVIGVVVNNMEDVLPYYYGHSYYQDYRSTDVDADGGEASRSGVRRDRPPSATRTSARARATGSSG
jgi:Mrp family chromosome partitioning ATPase